MNKLLVIVQLIPMLIDLIKSVEAAIPGQGKGEQKLAMIRQILEVTDDAVGQLWPTLEKVIAILVKTFNAVKAW